MTISAIDIMIEPAKVCYHCKREYLGKSYAKYSEKVLDENNKVITIKIILCSKQCFQANANLVPIKLEEGKKPG